MMGGFLFSYAKIQSGRNKHTLVQKWKF
jgi:hypothetical protein